ncbi:hypothetical protein HanRHA438_Chr10g0444711 [Helianthus annuus]|nr:hypothetical protein HanRHA438_Chr10g0444711 [Helianthus annuus]
MFLNQQPVLVFKMVYCLIPSTTVVMSVVLVKQWSKISVSISLLSLFKRKLSEAIGIH